MNKNTTSTRYYSSAQESEVCKVLGATKTPNSGAAKFAGGDCIQREASLLVECKTVMTDKNSVSIKKEWLKKLRDEAFSQGLYNTCLAFNFGPEQESYYIIDKKLMKFLVESLISDNKIG